MNHSNFSPGQPNEAVGKKVTPSSRNSMEEDDTCGSDPGSKKQSVGSRFLLSEDLQKIKHSSHRNAARGESSSEEGDEDMDDNDHNHVMKDLLYPALEGSSSRNMEFDFFEEDYNAAQQAAMNSSVASTSLAAAAPSFRSSTTSMANDSFRDASVTSNASSRSLMNDSASSNSFATASSNASQSYLNYLRRRGSTNDHDSFDQTTQKHRR
jgi:hypothetical protein